MWAGWCFLLHISGRLSIRTAAMQFYVHTDREWQCSISKFCALMWQHDVSISVIQYNVYTLFTSWQSVIFIVTIILVTQRHYINTYRKATDAWFWIRTAIIQRLYNDFIDAYILLVLCAATNPSLRSNVAFRFVYV